MTSDNPEQIGNNLRNFVSELNDDQPALDAKDEKIKKTKDYQELHNKNIKKRPHRHKKGEPQKDNLDRAVYDEMRTRPARKREKMDEHTERKNIKYEEIPIQSSFDPDIPLTKEEMETYRTSQSSNYDSEPNISTQQLPSISDKDRQQAERNRYWKKQMEDTKR